MMESMTEWRDRLDRLLREQGICVLATQDEDGPYTSLVGFAVTDDLSALLFATPRHTHKYKNLLRHPQVAACIDDRRGNETDFHEAVAVTALGTVEAPATAEHEALLGAYLNRHPYLESFVRSPTCAFMKIRVDRYLIVSRFQSVVELRMS
jgi:nitroimidazol reductase NimA-like FMN-containing flavoprotein (pyridoxamine 5'-phosphate oxidase superfamily)